MKILHTSDWHLGRTLRGADLTPAFEQWADFLVNFVRAEHVDAVLVAGDIYDRGTPPLVMVNLLSELLVQLTEHAHVVLTAGNHDSAPRLGFGRQLMRSEMAICTDPAYLDRPIVLPNQAGEPGAIVYALPYLDPDVERLRLAQEGKKVARSHEAVMKAALQRVRADILQGEYSAVAVPLAKVPRIVMAHAFVTGGVPSDSEQSIQVGGVDSVPASIFDLRGPSGEPLINYVALGHLHGAQQIGAVASKGAQESGAQESDVRGSDVQEKVPAADRQAPADGQALAADGPLIRYSGSPIAFSFSEEHHHKSAVLLQWPEPDEQTSPPAAEPAAPQTQPRQPRVQLIAAPVYRPLTTIRGTLAELLGPTFAAHRHDFVRAHVTDKERPMDLYAQLRRVFPHLLDLHHVHDAIAIDTAALRSAQADPVTFLREFFQASSNGAPLSKEEDALLMQLWEQHVRAERNEGSAARAARKQPSKNGQQQESDKNGQQQESDKEVSADAN